MHCLSLVWLCRAVSCQPANSWAPLHSKATYLCLVSHGLLTHLLSFSSPTHDRWRLAVYSPLSNVLLWKLQNYTADTWSVGQTSCSLPCFFLKVLIWYFKRLMLNHWSLHHQPTDRNSQKLWVLAQCCNEEGPLAILYDIIIPWHSRDFWLHYS